jgi:DNA-binding transcriptional MerR regulator
MEYSVNKLSKLSGVSARTLRYYDEIGLLKPARVAQSGYRIYGPQELDVLQQILFYRELRFSLEEIKSLLAAPDFDRTRAFESHLTALHAKRERLDALIRNVTRSVAAMKGEIAMADKEKFEGFKQQLIDENEEKYGAEIREKYGEDAINRSNQKVKGMSKEQYAEVEKLSAEVNETLKAAFEQGDPSGELAQKACELHKRWLCYFWDSYSKEAHKGLAQMYVDDPRFTEYYDKIAPGCAPFLRDAINIFCISK